MNERHPMLQKPVYRQLLVGLIRQATYPSTFTSNWDAYSGDVYQDDFMAFRNGSHGVKDVLVTIYYLLRAEYVSYAVSMIEENSRVWQIVEASLFALTSVSKLIQESEPQKEHDVQVRTQSKTSKRPSRWKTSDIPKSSWNGSFRNFAPIPASIHTR